MSVSLPIIYLNETQLKEERDRLSQVLAEKVQTKNSLRFTNKGLIEKLGYDEFDRKMKILEKQYDKQIKYLIRDLRAIDRRL